MSVVTQILGGIFTQVLAELLFWFSSAVCRTLPHCFSQKCDILLSSSFTNTSHGPTCCYSEHVNSIVSTTLTLLPAPVQEMSSFV